jgi:hypothetical protein
MPQTEHAERERQQPNDNEALQQARERAREVRRRFIREWNQTGVVAGDTKIQAAEVALDYRDLLVDYREDVTTPPWEDRELDWIVDLVGEQIEQEVTESGLGRGAEVIQRPKFVEVDSGRLYRLTKKFDQIWRELGFGSEVSQSNALYQIPDGSEPGALDQ